MHTTTPASAADDQLRDRIWTDETIGPEPDQPPDDYGWVISETGRLDPENYAHWSTDPRSLREREKMRRYGYRPYELQAEHDSPVFMEVHNGGYTARDDLAQLDCVKRALAGDPHACRALEFLKLHSRAEYDAIITHYLAQ